MKYVGKGQAPPAFELWKVQGDEGWAPAYGDLQQPEKGELHAALLKEQGWVCCYCGRRVHKVDSHIEHYRPQKAIRHRTWNTPTCFALVIRLSSRVFRCIADRRKAENSMRRCTSRHPTPAASNVSSMPRMARSCRLRQAITVQST